MLDHVTSRSSDVPPAFAVIHEVTKVLWTRASLWVRLPAGERSQLLIALLRTLVAPDRQRRYCVTEALSEHRSEWFSEWFDDGGFFTVRVRFDDPLHLVVMSGELDLASLEAAVRACSCPITSRWSSTWRA